MIGVALGTLERDILAIITTLGTVWVVYLAIRFSRTMPWFYRALWLLGIMYPLGKSLQLWVIGPAVVRGYAADIGFIACLVCVLGLTRGYSRSVARTARMFAVYGLVVAVTIEVIQMFANSRIEKAGLKFGPRGDWADMIIYLVSFLVVLYLLSRVEIFFVTVDEARKRLAKQQMRAKRRAKKRAKS